MRTRILAICAAIVMLGMLIMPASVQAIADGDKDERLIATYGGYGIHYLTLGDYGRIMGRGTMGDALVDILFTGEKATGAIVLGEEEYEVELVKVDSDLVADGTSLVHKSIEGGILFEGYLRNQEGKVRLIRYQDVVVGEIDLGDVVYGFSAAASLLSAGTILVAHNNEYVEKLIELGILQLPEPELVFGPPVIGIDPFDLPPLDFEEDDLYICPESQYVPSLKEHLAAGDDVILLRLVTEPHLVEERIQELRELADLNENVLKLIALYTLTHIEDEDADIDDVRELLEGLIAAQGSAASYLESLADLIGPIGGYGGNPSWRSVSVYAVADEEYIMVHGANWRIAIGNIIEAGDNEFESQFQINFVVEERMSWDSNDAHTTLHALFNEVRSEVKPDRSIYNVMAAFTGQYTRDCTAWGMAEQGTTIWEGGTLGDNIIVKQEAGGFQYRVVWHEFSHIFGCTCFGTEPHPVGCIMSVWWQTAAGWCTGEGTPDCRGVITGNKNKPFVW